MVRFRFRFRFPCSAQDSEGLTQATSKLPVPAGGYGRSAGDPSIRGHGEDPVGISATRAAFCGRAWRDWGS